MDRKTKVATITGIVFMLLLIISATYSYFMVNTTSNTSETIITGKTEKVATASLKQNTSSLKLNLSASDMSLSNVGNYYADDENDYAPNKSLGYHELSTLTLTNSNEDNNIYKCSMNVEVTFDTSENSIGSAILKDDLKIHFMIGNQNYEYDLSEYKETGNLNQEIITELIGNSDKILYGYVELKNKETEQNYLAGKNLNISINTTLNKCELTGKEGVFMIFDNGWGGDKYYRNELYKEKIVSASFVNYIDSNYEDKIHWDLSEKQNNEVIGWLEDTGNETYNLYIGTSKSNQVIFSKNMDCGLKDLTLLKTITFSNLNTSMTTTMRYIFWGVSNLETMDISNFDMSNVVYADSMFSGMNKIKNLDVSNWNTSKLITMTGLFSGNLTNITTLDLRNWNTSNVTRMDQLFRSLDNIEEIDLSSFDTSKVTTMGLMFDAMHKLNKINLNNFNTSKVNDISSMFAAMDKIKDLDISNFDTSSVMNMNNTFGALVLEKLNLNHLETTNVINMTGMFCYSSISNLILSKKIDTSKVANMQNMFLSFQTDKLDINMFKTDNLTNVSNMFQGARINTIDMRNMDFKNVGDYAEMFDKFQGNEIIVKDEYNKNWIEARLNEVGVTANVNVAS